MRCLVLLSLILGSSLYAAEDLPQKKPSPPVEQKQEAGKGTYEQFCIICHQDGVAGAPKFQNEKDWGPRLKDRKIEDLVKSAQKGLNLMPAKGTCTECSDEDLKAAILYMLPKS